jgi:hypothetical protein
MARSQKILTIDEDIARADAAKKVAASGQHDCGTRGGALAFNVLDRFAKYRERLDRFAQYPLSRGGRPLKSALRMRSHPSMRLREQGREDLVGALAQPLDQLANVVLGEGFLGGESDRSIVMRALPL